MPEAPYLSLSAEDRRDALRLAQDKGQCRAFLLEKDIRVVMVPGVPFDALIERRGVIEARANAA